jgi:hypothetical protein
MSKHVIFSRNNDNGILTTERIRQLAPAAFSTTKHERLSDRYAALHTSDLLPVLADYGYQPVQAAQKRVNKGGSVEHAMHMLAFTNAHDIEGNDGLRSEIVLYNSHDGTGSVKLFAGAFRFLCSNGIVAGDGFASRTYHNRTAMLGFEEVLRNTIEMMPAMMDKIEAMRSLQLSRGEAYDLAMKSVAARWDGYTGDMSKRGTFAVTKTVMDVLQAQRIQDENNDAWTVFNRIQENIIRGNAFIRSVTEKQPEGVMRKARPISAIAEHQRVNTALWDIANEMVAA